MLEPGQHLRLAGELGRDLQRHGAVGQVALAGEVDPAECPPAQLADQPEAQELVAHLGHRRQAEGQAIGRPRIDQFVKGAAPLLHQGGGILLGMFAGLPGREHGSTEPVACSRRRRVDAVEVSTLRFG